MIRYKSASFQTSRLLTAIILSALSLLALSGQNSFRPGIIIVNDTTTMKGEISAVDNEGIITSCLFRAGTSINPISFTAADIRGWQLNSGRRFVSGKYISPEISGMFLEILFDGVSDLFFYNDISEDHYLIRDMNGRLFSLTSGRKGKRSSESGDATTDASGIRAVLRICMADAPALADRINTLEPDREGLTNLMHDYHILITRSESDIVYEMPPPSLEAGAGLFLRYSIDLFNADATGDLAGYSYDPALYPGIGISLTTSFPRITRNFRTVLNLSLAERYVYGLRVEEIPNYSVTLYEEMHLHHLILSGELLFEYAFGTGRLQPSLFAGPAIQYVINDDSRIDYDLAGEAIVISESIPFESGSQFHGGVMAGAGVSYAMNASWTLYLRTGYSRLSGDDSFSGLNAFNVSAGITF